MNFWSICASISVTIIYIWTKYGTQHKYHTINTQECPNSRKLKIQDGGDHLTKSRNRKLIRVTSSNEGLNHMCVDLSDYNRYLNQIWYTTQIPHYQHAGLAKLTETENRRHLEFRKNVNNFGLDTYIYTKFYGKMHHGHAEMTTWRKVKTGS